MRNSSNVVLAKMNLNGTSSHVPTSQNKRAVSQIIEKCFLKTASSEACSSPGPKTTFFSMYAKKLTVVRG